MKNSVSIVRSVTLMLVCTVSIAPLPAWAGIEWHSASLTYLKGHDYRIGDPDRDVFTFEHAAGTSWGDSFLFWEHLISDDGTNQNYGEWSPRLSWCKTGLFCINKNNENALVRDLMFSSTLEKGDGFTNYLYGAGVQLRMPGFKYFNVDFYRRQHDFNEDNWQTTVTWALPFDIAGQTCLYDGFIDWYSGTSDEHSSMNWTSQLKWNLGKVWGSSSPLYLGVEYVYWQNKFGIEDAPVFRTNEKNVNLLLKWHL